LLLQWSEKEVQAGTNVAKRSVGLYECMEAQSGAVWVAGAYLLLLLAMMATQYVQFNGSVSVSCRVEWLRLSLVQL